MENYLELLKQDIRFVEGLKACINCGICTAICPAAEFYDYDPRKIVDTVQKGDNDDIEKLLKSETIWYCGECMSQDQMPERQHSRAGRHVAKNPFSEAWFFTESEKGRQQFAIKRTVGENIFKYGYCVATYAVRPDMHREQGPVWQYILDNSRDIYERLGGKIDELGEGPLRKIPEDAKEELRKIFEITGGTELFETIEVHSKRKQLKWGFNSMMKG